MKIQIRQGVFETNSSSTHSLSMSSKDLDAAMYDIMMRILDRSDFESELDPDEYLIQNEDGTYTLLLKGMYLSEGEESRHAYSIIQTDMAKLQFAAMVLKYYEDKFPELRTFDEEYYKKYSLHDQYHLLEAKHKWDRRPSFYETRFAKTFEGMARSFVKAKYDKTVSNVVFSLEYSVYFDREEFGNQNFQDIETFTNFVNNLLWSDGCFTYCDEAYHAYNQGPVITVY